MTTGTAGPRIRLSRAEWRVLALLMISVFLNYVDRANLSVGATDIRRELFLNDYQLGKLLSAFFWTYALCQLLGAAGWLVDRFHVGLVYATGFFLWSGATAITGVAHGFATILVLRLILGIGESVSYPVYSRILASNYPEHHRGFANALIDAGSKLGPAFGTLLGGLMMAQIGWRAFFLALGFGSFLWLAPWLAWMPRGAAAAGHTQQGGPGILAILRHRPAWCSFFGLFCSNYFWYFLITWLPPYLEMERGFPKTKMALFGSLAFLAISVSSAVSGWVSDQWIAGGGTPTRVRKTFAGLGLTLSTIILPVAVVRDENLAMALLMLACLSFGLYTSNLFAITQTLAGPSAAGKWTSLQNGVGNLAGVAAPWLTGFMVQETRHFYWAFVVAAAIALAGAALFVLGIREVKQVEFESPREHLIHRRDAERAEKDKRGRIKKSSVRAE